VGYYLEVYGSTKKEFLDMNGELIGDYPPDKYERDDDLLVCLVNNGDFLAAGIVYSYEELARFNHISDRRPKLWYYVNRKHLEPYLPKILRILS